MSLHSTQLIALMFAAVLTLIAILELVHITGRYKAAGKIVDAEKKLLDAASREFEGAKPSLIHACDTVIDSLPNEIDLSALQAKALISLTALMQRLLGGNVLLTGADILLMTLLPTAFAALPKMVDTAAFKGLLKEEVVKVIRGATL